MAGRWKVGAGGQAEWEEGVNAPNQIAPPAGFDPNTGQPLSGGGGQPPIANNAQPAAGAPAPAANSAQNWNREQFRDAWQARGMITRQDLRNYAATIGATVDSAGRVRLPSGEVIDMMEGWSGAGETGQGRASWGGVAGAELKHGQTAGAGGGAPASAAPAASAGAGAAAGAAQPNPEQDRWNELYNELMGRSKQTLAVDRNDPTIRAQVDPYAAQQERARRDYLADLAEKAGPSANLRGETRMAAERKGQQVGLFEAELIGREINARRTEIQNALAQRGGMLSEQQRLALQRELGLLEDATKRLDIQSSERVGMAGVGAQSMAAQLANELGRDRLAFDITDRDEYWRAVEDGLLD